jgi:hypothetical protein
MAFKLDRLSAYFPIVKADRAAASPFIALWEKMCGKIERQETSQDGLLAAQAQQLALINQAITDIQIAQATANANAAGTTGADTVPGMTVSSLVTWVPGPSVPLTGVAANNLTIPGSGPQQDADVGILITNVTQYVMQGEYRLVEVIGGVDGATFGPWNFSVSYPEAPPSSGTYPGAVLNTDSATVAAFVQALATTGAVEYRLDFRKVSGPTVSNLRAYLFARRS